MPKRLVLPILLSLVPIAGLPLGASAGHNQPPLQPGMVDYTPIGYYGPAESTWGVKYSSGGNKAGYDDVLPGSLNFVFRPDDALRDAFVETMVRSSVSYARENAVSALSYSGHVAASF